MSLPQAQLESLQRQLAEHEERLALLQHHLSQLGNAEPPEKKSRAGKGEPVADRKGRKPELLAAQRQLIEREIRVHTELLALGRNPKVLEALRELADNPDYARKAAGDPSAEARRRGIDLPDMMRLRLEQVGDRVHLHITHYEDTYPFMVTWNSQDGFTPLRVVTPRQGGQS